MKTYSKIGMLILLVCMMASCDENRDRSGKDRSTGGTAEIMVVVQNDDQWTGRIGD